MTTKAMAIVLPMSILAFCTWAVYLGGLASMQAICKDGDDAAAMANPTDSNPSMTPSDSPWVIAGTGTAFLSGVQGFSAASLPCMRVYRYYWWIMSYEFVIVTGLIIAAASGMLARTRLGWLGLFAVAFMLYIEASNAFLNAQSVDWWQSGKPLHRVRTTTAGAIMTAVMNAFIIFALGYACTTAEEHTVVEKDAYNAPAGGVVVQGATSAV